MRTVSLFIGIFIVAAAVAYTVRVGAGKVGFYNNVPMQVREVARFRLLYGSFNGSSATYTLQTPPEEKNYAEDCLGCKEEVGNAVVFAEFGCLNISKHLFTSNSEDKKVVEKEPIRDSQGKVVGQRYISVFENNDGKIVGARMYWIEGVDFWAIQAPTVDLTKALRESGQYNDIRKTVAQEIENYVPIQNANTIGKDPCEQGLSKN